MKKRMPKAIKETLKEMAMKKWIWLLALPYVVTISTETGNHALRIFEMTEKTNKRLLYSLSPVDIVCDPSVYDCSALDDMAEALNQAHERRIHEKTNAESR